MKKAALTCAICAFTVFAARDAAAQVGQAWTDRGYLNLNVGFESVSGELNDATTFRIYDEDATLSVAQAIDSGALFDFSVGARVWRNASVGIGFHTGSTHSEAAVQGSIPHPLFFNRHRPVATSVGDLKRSERGVHLQFGYMMPINDKVSLHVLAGPSFFKLSQEVVSDIAVSEQGGSFSSVNATPTVTKRTDSPVGVNIGADIAYQLLQRGKTKVGAGLFLRWAGASADVKVLQNTVDSDVGGLQIGFGGRVRF